MKSHAPPNYVCPLCVALDGIESKDTWVVQNDIFFRDDLVMGFVSSKAIKGNDGHPLVIPVAHYESLYDVPRELGCRLFEFSREVALALKAVRRCDGVTVFQNNEPAGGQHVFHYHMHIMPRFDGDNFQEEIWKAAKSEPKDRLQYVNDLRNYFKKRK